MADEIGKPDQRQQHAENDPTDGKRPQGDQVLVPVGEYHGARREHHLANEQENEHGGARPYASGESIEDSRLLVSGQLHRTLLFPRDDWSWLRYDLRTQRS